MQSYFFAGGSCLRSLIWLTCTLSQDTRSEQLLPTHPTSSVLNQYLLVLPIGQARNDVYIHYNKWWLAVPQAGSRRATLSVTANQCGLGHTDWSGRGTRRVFEVRLSTIGFCTLFMPAVHSAAPLPNKLHQMASLGSFLKNLSSVPSFFSYVSVFFSLGSSFYNVESAAAEFPWWLYVIWRKGWGDISYVFA